MDEGSDCLYIFGESVETCISAHCYYLYAWFCPADISYELNTVHSWYFKVSYHNINMILE